MGTTVTAWNARNATARAAPSVGAVVMAILLAHTPPMKHAGRNLLLAVTGFGAATVVRKMTLSLRQAPRTQSTFTVTRRFDLAPRN